MIFVLIIKSYQVLKHSIGNHEKNEEQCSGYWCVLVSVHCKHESASLLMKWTIILQRVSRNFYLFYSFNFYKNQVFVFNALSVNVNCEYACFFPVMQ